MEYSLLAFMSFGLIARAARGFSTRWIAALLENRILVYIGKISYGIYLYHNFVPQMAGKALHLLDIHPPESPTLRFFLYTSITLLGSAISWRLIERPMNAFKDRFRSTYNNCSK